MIHTYTLTYTPVMISVWSPTFRGQFVYVDLSTNQNGPAIQAGVVYHEEGLSNRSS